MTLSALVDACVRLGIQLAVDGTQLRVRATPGSVTPEVRAALVEHKPELIKRLAGGAAKPVARAASSPADEFPLSYSQQGLWLLHQAEPASLPAYNVRAARRFRGNLDVAALEQAVQRLIRRHDPLRTVFLNRDGTPTQRVLPEVAFVVNCEDLTTLLVAQREERWKAELNSEGKRIFDIGVPPLFALRLFRLTADEHILILNAHHLIADAWSAGLLLREIAEAYSSGDAQDRRDSYRYSDYIQDQRQRPLDEHLAFWKMRLDGMPPLQLPIDFARPLTGTSSYQGASIGFELSPELNAAIRIFARREGFTLFQMLLASFAALLQRLSGQNDFGIGYALSGRDSVETETLLGYFVNLVILRPELSGRPSFRDLLRQTRERATEAFQHQEAPFYRVVRDLRASGDSSGGSLLQALFLYLQEARSSAEFPGLETTVCPVPSVTSKYDLSLHIEDHGNGLSGLIEYSTELFDGATAEAIAKRLVRLLSAAVAEPDLPLQQLEILDEAERQTLIHGFNATTHEIPETTLTQLFERQVVRTPSATALVFAGQNVSYRELNERANRLAHHLIGRGVGPEDRVGICLERSIEMVVSLLGVHKAGAAYVPLDPEYPAARLSYMTADSSPVVAITSPTLRHRLPDSLPVVLFNDIADSPARNPQDTDRKSPLLPSHPAYVIYTSGSTGTPKGASNPHQALVNRILWMQATYQLAPTDVVLQKTPYSFDVSGWEFFWPLLTGATLVIAPPNSHRDAGYLARAIVEERITTIHFVPSMLRAFLEDPACASCRSLRRVICSGEALPGDLQKLFFDRLRGTELHNLYGPTEAAIDVTAWKCVPGDETPPIGAPIWNTKIYVLDQALEPVPVGVAGELFLAGVGLARGYLNRPGLTAERFVPDPHGPIGTRMYRTGDLARWRRDGNVEYLGRIDQQVKIRGLRIEPGEIETVLLAQPGIAQAAVVVRETASGGKQLVAYLVPVAGTKPDVAELRRSLGSRLPEYMVPSAFVTLSELPLTSSGKLDRRALPAPERELESYRGPRTREEEVLCGLFAELLSVPRAGIDDNFFRLGGDSIVSIMMVSRAAKAGLQLTPQDIFQHPTVADLAAIAKKTEAVTARKEEAEGEFAPTPIMHWMLDHLGSDCRFSQSVLLRVPTDLREDHLLAALNAVTDTHGMLRSRLERRDSEWVLSVAAPGTVPAISQLRRIDSGGFTEEALREAEMRLDPMAGRMLEAVWFLAAARLLLVIHHLAVDGVSWRILVPDLATACTAARTGMPELARESLPFRSWAKRLSERALEPSIRHEIETWQAITADCPHALPGVTLVPSRDTIITARSFQISFSPTTSAVLLQSAPAAFRAGVNDVLLAALASAVTESRSESGPVLIDVEGHGREPFESNIDFSRTVGWFTSLFPVRLDVRGHRPGENVKRVKEQLRSVPGKGLSYGILRYLNQETSCLLAGRAEAQIALNYLGRVSSGGTQDWDLAEEFLPHAGTNPEMPLAHLIAVGAVTIEGPGGPILTATWTWASAAVPETTVRAMAEIWRKFLEGLVEEVGQGAHGQTPSDFALVRISQSQIEHLEAEYPSLEEILPLSPLQEGLLFHSLYDDAQRDVYTIQVAVTLEGKLDRERLYWAAETMLRRHANLRAVMRHEGLDKPVQIIARDFEMSWKETHSPRDPETLLTADRGRRFDLTTGPLLRFSLNPLVEPKKIAGDRHLLVVTIHHILMDGWSLPVFFRELLTLYSGGTDVAGLPEVRPYSQYLSWLSKRDNERALHAWRNYLADVIEPTRLAGIRSPDAGYSSPERWTADLSPELTSQLQKLAQSRGLTLSTAIQGLWAILLARLTGKSSVVFGVTVSGRPAELIGVDQMVGLFINSVPCRAEINPATSLSALLERIQDQQAQMLPYQHIGLAEIQRTAGIGELFDTLLVFENYPLDMADFAGLEGIRVTGAEVRDATHYPLTVVVTPGERLHLRIDYDPARFDRNSAERIGNRLIRLAEAAVADPDAPLHRFDILNAEERYQLLETFNGTCLQLPESTLPELFERQAERSPDAVALICEDRSLTYGELNRRANRLGHHLISLGVKPEELVGIRLERSIEMMVAMLGIHKAGGAYLPFDPEYPGARVRGMIADARPVCVITADWLIDNQQSIDRSPAHNPSQADRILPLDPAHPAYVIYTSGSTGVPKGVPVTHQNVVRLFDATDSWFHFGAKDVWTLFHSFAFDFSVWEIWGPLLYGGKLVVVPKLVSRSPEEFLALLAHHGVTILNQTPSAFYQLMQADAMHPELSARLALRYVIFGGEALDPARLEDWYRTHDDSAPVLVNMYGITETTVHVTYQPLDREVARKARGSVIGANIPDLRIYVLDARLEPVPAGVIGEMFVAGSGLARGYLNRPALTSERFLADPHGAPGTRMYRTGDLAKWRSDGNLEYLGRIDQQVKIRGFRIELGDIESALAALDGVAQAAVMVRTGAGDSGSDAKQLVGYVVPSVNAPCDTAELRRELSKSLPDYMVPSAIVVLPEMPLTANGKLNRAALPPPSASTTGGVAPRDEDEAAIARIWAEVLGCGDVGVTDDFFERGGQSLLATQVITRIRERCGVKLQVRVLFEQPTVEGLARAVRTARAAATDPQIAAKPQLRRTARSQRQVNLTVDGELATEASVARGD
jgi:amino acid adenylation domain-containing protein/non-ribosomal peptide synthase protein (TIGR01720 family)